MSQGGRRKFLIAAGAMFAAPRFASGQASRRTPVLGILSPGTYESGRDFQSRLLERLHELGWTEGETLRVERVYADYDMSRMPKLAADLVAKKVDVIWTGSPIGAVAAARATSAIPTVFWRVGSPIEFGLIESFARPGRNATGVAWTAPETTGKRIQLLREIAPNTRRLAAVSAPPGDGETVSGKKFDWRPIVARAEAASRQFGFEFLAVYVSNASDVARAAAQIAKWGADCMGVADVPQTIGARKQIIEMARRLRLPDYYVEQDWALAGGLFSYSIALPPTLRRTAEMIDQILRGAKPADVPVELPSIYELVVNLRTAKSLGLNIPQAVLLRTDRVVE